MGSRVHVETWGCQMNVADSEQMLALLRREDYAPTEKAEDADLIILNTCHIREKARHKVVSRLGVLKRLKRERPDLVIAVAGCVAQAEGKKLLAASEAIDVILGPGQIAKLPSLVKQARSARGQAPQTALGFRTSDEETLLCQQAAAEATPLTGRNEVSRFVTIQQGCDNFCTFCVVPRTRGREISVPPEVIRQQTERLVAGGAKEIFLLGQNVNSYGLDLQRGGKLPRGEASPFVDLLAGLCEETAVESLRFTTSNPHDFTPELAALFGRYRQLGAYIHLPVQSGSDPVLERMRRKVTAEQYHERIAWLRAARPDIAISTDLIVGFPGESDADFEATLALMEAVRFSFVYAFQYSPRPQTPATRYPDSVPEEVKAERLRRLNALQDRITIAGNEAEIGRTRRALVTYESAKESGIYYGRTPQFRLTRIPAGRNLVGQTVDVEITGANKTALVGKLL